MIVIDSCALILLIVGAIRPNNIQSHKKTSIYDKNDYVELIRTIGHINNLIVTPNVWTEVDNSLNGFGGNEKFQYLEILRSQVTTITEQYEETSKALNSDFLFDLGITDCLLIGLAKKHKLLITADSALANFATASSIPVYDLVFEANKKFI